MTVSALPILSPFSVYDTFTRSVIYRSPSDSPVPEDIASRLVLRIYACDDMIYLEV